MSKICTDIEQSKKLLKLGIDPGTADMSYVVGSLIVNPPTNYGYNITAAELESKGVIPSWSLSAILTSVFRRS